MYNRLFKKIFRLWCKCESKHLCKLAEKRHTVGLLFQCKRCDKYVTVWLFDRAFQSVDDGKCLFEGIVALYNISVINYDV